MQTKLHIRNIVLVGMFNPLLYDKYFFIKNDLLKEEEISEKSVFGNVFGGQLNSNKFQVIFSLNQIIITSFSPEVKDEIISNFIIKFIKAAYLYNSINAFGYNLHWYLEENIDSLEETSKHYFYRDDIDLLRNFFNNNDAMFGVYASTNIKDSRLKLDIKPTKIKDIDNNIQNKFNFIFNFHFDLMNKDEEEREKFLSEYKLYFEESEKIMLFFIK